MITAPTWRGLPLFHPNPPPNVAESAVNPGGMRRFAVVVGVDGPCTTVGTGRWSASKNRIGTNKLPSHPAENLARCLSATETGAIGMGIADQARHAVSVSIPRASPDLDGGGTPCGVASLVERAVAELAV